MDFIFDNLLIIIIAASGLAQWIKATRDAKRERENESHPGEFDPQDLEEFLEEAERRHKQPVVPPPLPKAAVPQPPRLDRSPPPLLKKSNRPNAEPKPFISAAHYQEDAMQAALAEQLSGLKQAKKKQDAPQTTQREKIAPVAAGSIRDRLKNRNELRQAFLLKEFLDKPVGLR